MAKQPDFDGGVLVMEMRRVQPIGIPRVAAMVLIPLALSVVVGLTTSERVSGEIPPTDAMYVVVVAPGVEPQAAPEDIADTVLGRLETMGSETGRTATTRILEMHVVEAAALPTVISHASPPELGQEGRIVWVVTALGPFVGQRVPPGEPEVVADSGYFVIDDGTGDILEMGLPLIAP